MESRIKGTRKRSFEDESDSDSDSSDNDHVEPSPSKRVRQDDGDNMTHYSEFAQRMMTKMGHREGKGLGKYGQGRVDIVEASKQRGKRGLGLHLEGLEGGTIEWNREDEEELQVRQTPEWIPLPQIQLPDEEELQKWCQEGERKEVIDDETNFCDVLILSNILKSKSIFDLLGNDEFLKARTRANPFESIRGAIFQNRAAMKMAEMDATFDFMFTHSTKNSKEAALPDGKGLTYFADICAGPGGFSEYALWRLKWHGKGYGFTLRGNGANDFKIDAFLAGSPETFEPHYGKGGYNGDGDIYKEENLKEFRKFVLEQTNQEGVHFVMADGGFSVEGQENIQEILSKQLYLCQFLCAISILRNGGHFVCKLFDLFTPFSVGLVYLCRHSFEQVCIFKPHTSRPANSERYIVCKGKLPDTEKVHDYLFSINQHLNRLKGSDVDVVEIVPLLRLTDEENEFWSYMYTSNNRLGKKQVTALKKIQAFVQDTTLLGENQGEIRKQCLSFWKVPDEARAASRMKDPDLSFETLTKRIEVNLCKEPGMLTVDNLNKISSTLDRLCMVSGGQRVFLLGLGRTQVYHWDIEKTHERCWNKLGLMLELPKDTLLEAEVVQELKGEGRGQRRLKSVQIIDAVYLGGEYVGNMDFEKRFSMIELFVRALQKPTRREMAPLRLKERFSLNNADIIFDKLSVKLMKEKDEKKLCFPITSEQYFIPLGVHIVSSIKDPWLKCQSRSQRKPYFFNHKTRQSVFEHPGFTAATDYQYCLNHRLFWRWPERLDPNLIPCHGGEVSKQTFLQFVREKSKAVGL